ncbi:hypothetical protein E4T38_09652 [Aureobasidium subglaciale]|nr:hypothetical protein E4T38_09652 [Aureobasidium subglaciale]KAI5213623.1 hypothetical protein E4T40_09594 [Aureobasidium subglaciale]KAI5215357.1 hypothetical protein E4T41_09632 [Aureobasidium subglaciale]KAI5253280.1 hypothetical protein E4T46_09609 [Aureobasidium subglaciale]
MKNLVLLAASIAQLAHAFDAQLPAHTPSPSFTVSSINKQRATITGRAINPTGSGQIGVTPVTDDLGDTGVYHLSDLGPDHPVLTISGNEYHQQYIEGHTDFLTVETKTEGSKTKTSTVQALVATATADGSDWKNGDITITFPESFANTLKDKAGDAISKCGISRRNTKRSFRRRSSIARRQSVTCTYIREGSSCLIDEAIDLSADDELFEPEIPETGESSNFWQDETFFEDIGIELAQDAPAEMVSAIAAIESEAQKKKAMVIYASFLAALETSGAIAIVNIPANGIGQPSEESGDDDDTKQCDPSKAADIDSWPCTHEKCKGDDDDKCTEGDDKGCACVPVIDGPDHIEESDQEWWDEREQILIAIAALTVSDSSPAKCFANSDGPDFYGTEQASPATWCVCTATDPYKVGVYSTIASQTAPCSYSALPTETITIDHGPTITTAPTECRTETATGKNGGPYCTCNDNKQHGMSVWSFYGTATTGCLEPTETPSPPAEPTPTCNVDKPYKMSKHNLEAYADQFCDDHAGEGLRTVPLNPYSNAVQDTGNDGLDGAKLTLFAYVDKECLDKTGIKIDKDQCTSAIKKIGEVCDEGSDDTIGGAVSIDCQWYNITAVPGCMGSTESFENPGSCDVGNLPGGYSSWPLGDVKAP